MRMDEAIFKCKKCRHILFKSQSVVNSHNETYNINTKLTDCQDLEKEKYVWFLRDDNLEEWIERQIDQGNWIKGKLLCPTCNNRIGSYDFVSGSQCTCGIVLPSIHVVKSKVDFEQKSEIDNIKEKIHLPPVLTSFMDNSALEGVNNNLSAAENSASQILQSNLCIFKNIEEMNSVPENNNAKEMNTFLEEDESIITYKNCEKILKMKERKVSERVKLNVKKNSNHETIDAASENNASLHNTLVCAVCLDVYFSPFICQPCGHTFCECCLRIIAKPNPTKTYCPLCRQLIGSCELNRDFCKKVRTYFPIEHNARLKENRSDTMNLPLPWTPRYHFQNLKNIRRHFFTDERDDNVRNFWSNFCASLPTIGIIILLNVFSGFMFLLSYFGCSYIPSILAQLSIFISRIHIKYIWLYELKGFQEITVTFILIGFISLLCVIYIRIKSSIVYVI